MLSIVPLPLKVETHGNSKVWTRVKEGRKIPPDEPGTPTKTYLHFFEQ